MVSVTELKILILSIVEKRQPIGIRFRLIGQLWYPNFLRVIRSSNESEILFHDEKINKHMSISDLSNIIQFELDSRFEHYQPNFHYQVTIHEIMDQTNKDNHYQYTRLI